MDILLKAPRLADPPGLDLFMGELGDELCFALALARFFVYSVLRPLLLAALAA